MITPGKLGGPCAAEVYRSGAIYRLRDFYCVRRRLLVVLSLYAAHAPSPCAPTLAAAFADFNAVDADVKVDKVTQKSRGFGFVVFPTEQEMEDAIAKMDGATIDGQPIRVKEALPHDQAPGGRRARGGYRDGPGYRDSYR